ncbi:hypothetical protein ACUXST_000150 [Sphingomonas sp. F9_3S_D5_B_2]
MLDEFTVLDGDLATVLSRLNRRKLETFAAVAVDLLDFFDGPADPDVPDFSTACDGLAGCPVDAEPDDDALDGAWVERLDQSTAPLPRAVNAGWLTGIPEDVEDDNPAEDDDPDHGIEDLPQDPDEDGY